MTAPVDITALVLAGGQGSRMGGVDKGLQPFRGQPLVAWAIQNVRPQVRSVLVNANRNLADYAALGDGVVTDANKDFFGPLAGMAAGLGACTTEWMVILPCDSPYLPPDWVQRLWAAATKAQTPAAMVCAPERLATSGDAPLNEPLPLRRQPVFCLLHRSLAAPLNQALADGERKIDRWTAQHRCIDVPFAYSAAHPLHFVNINTLDELGALEHPVTP
jgi:molybdopterin-guanine dinucleotide biosynthesis protein A